MSAHPNLAERVLILPGNHDLNIVDRANPARMDLPTSPNRRLRQLRILSAMDELQGGRVRVVELGRHRLGKTLAEFLEPHLNKMVRFADEAKPLLSYALPELWAKVFPLFFPRARKTASASSCSTRMPTRISLHQRARHGVGRAGARHRDRDQAISRACWIIALITTPWISAAREGAVRAHRHGADQRQLVRAKDAALAGKVILMHGHRHIDWIGHCAGLVVVSAPSPVMEVTDEKPTAFYIHTLAIGTDGRLKLLTPSASRCPAKLTGKPSPTDCTGTVQNS